MPSAECKGVLLVTPSPTRTHTLGTRIPTNKHHSCKQTSTSPHSARGFLQTSTSPRACTLRTKVPANKHHPCKQAPAHYCAQGFLQTSTSFRTCTLCTRIPTNKHQPQTCTTHKDSCKQAPPLQNSTIPAHLVLL